jgi:hypothetical protein
MQKMSEPLVVTQTHASTTTPTFSLWRTLRVLKEHRRTPSYLEANGRIGRTLRVTKHTRIMQLGVQGSQP